MDDARSLLYNQQCGWLQNTCQRTVVQIQRCSLMLFIFMFIVGIVKHTLLQPGNYKSFLLLYYFAFLHLYMFGKKEIFFEDVKTVREH